MNTTEQATAEAPLILSRIRTAALGIAVVAIGGGIEFAQMAGVSRTSDQVGEALGWIAIGSGIVGGAVDYAIHQIRT